MKGKRWVLNGCYNDKLLKLHTCNNSWLQAEIMGLQQQHPLTKQLLKESRLHNDVYYSRRVQRLFWGLEISLEVMPMMHLVFRCDSHVTKKHPQKIVVHSSPSGGSLLMCQSCSVSIVVIVNLKDFWMLIPAFFRWRLTVAGLDHQLSQRLKSLPLTK